MARPATLDEVPVLLVVVALSSLEHAAARPAMVSTHPTANVLRVLRMRATYGWRFTPWVVPGEPDVNGSRTLASTAASCSYDSRRIASSGASHSTTSISS